MNQSSTLKGTCFFRAPSSMMDEFTWMPLIPSPLYEGHFTHETRAVTLKLWEPKTSVQRPSQGTFKITKCDHKLSSVVWSHMWLDPQTTIISMYFYSCGVLTDDISKWHGLLVLCWAYLQQEVVFENNPSDHENMIHLMPCRNPCRLYIHLAFTYSICPLSVVWSQTWTGSAFSTNESAWNPLVTGTQSRVWSDPHIIRITL